VREFLPDDANDDADRRSKVFDDTTRYGSGPGGDRGGGALGGTSRFGLRNARGRSSTGRWTRFWVFQTGFN